MTNQMGLRFVILMALTAVLAMMLATGCGPAQDIPPVAEEPTVAPAPEATPVYYPEVIAQRDPALHPILNAFVLQSGGFRRRRRIRSKRGRSSHPDGNRACRVGGH